jgi:transcription antitermination factor NusA-like protein
MKYSHFPIDAKEGDQQAIAIGVAGRNESASAKLTSRRLLILSLFE